MKTLLTKKFILFSMVLVMIVLAGFMLTNAFSDDTTEVISIDDTNEISQDIILQPQEKIEVNKTGNKAFQRLRNLTTTDTTQTVIPQDDKPFSFVVIADSESYKAPNKYNDELESMLIKTKSLNSDFAIFSGDLVAAPNQANLKVLKKLIEQYFNQYYIAFGKHDIECGNSCVDAWKKIFFSVTPTSDKQRHLYHSFDYENTHFILLSTDYPLKHSIDDVQLAWLNTDLANTDKNHIIVVSHVPPVNFFKESAKDCHDMSCSEEQRDKLMNLLKKYKVDLVISGHEHAFDHKIVDGIDFVLAGNTGNGKRYKNTQWKNIFSHFSVTENSINLKAMNLDGELIREIKIK